MRRKKAQEPEITHISGIEEEGHNGNGAMETEGETREGAPRQPADLHSSRLSWLVDDFQGVTSSVYEAVMVAAHRARQIGRRQKDEIDAYNASQVLTPETIEQEETAEKGIDRFHHPKPTVRAMMELKEKVFEYYYLEEEKRKAEQGKASSSNG